MIKRGKNKKVTIILLIAVVAIWSTIIYKVISTLNSNKSVQPVTMPQQRMEKKIEDDGFVPAHYERDPFLSIHTDTVTIIEEPVEAVYKTPKPIKPKLPPPTYCGLIKNEKETIAILKTHTKYYFLKRGEKDSLIKVLKIKPEEVTVIFDNERMTLPMIANESQRR